MSVVGYRRNERQFRRDVLLIHRHGRSAHLVCNSSVSHLPSPIGAWVGGGYHSVPLATESQGWYETFCSSWQTAPMPCELYCRDPWVWKESQWPDPQFGSSANQGQRLQHHLLQSPASEAHPPHGGRRQSHWTLMTARSNCLGREGGRIDA